VKRRLAAALVALVVAGACGSTVPASRRAAQARATGGDGVELFDTAGGSTGSTDATGNDLAAAGSASGSRRSTLGAGTSGNSTTGRLSGTTTPGVTPDKIYVGLSYAVNGSAANNAIGAAGISQGDPKAEDEAVIEDINARGGIAGHKVEGVWHEVDSASNAPWDVMDQQTCDDWTQDHKIFVALAEPLADSDTLVGCLQSRGVGLVTTGFSISDAQRFAQFPYYVELGMMSVDRAATAEVQALKAQGWFGGWDMATGAPSPATKPKVGIVTYDGAAWSRAVDRTLVPALRAAGYAPSSSDIIRVSPEHATADAGATGAAMSGAALKLRGDGVTHVIILDRKGLLTLFFARVAESQHYRPRYGWNTQNATQALKDGATLPAEQLVGSKGIGWFPGIDLSASDAASPAYINDTKRRCLALMKSKNIALADANAEAIAMNSCSSFWFLRDAINAAGGVLTRAGLMDGVARLGTSFLAAGNLANRYSATQHDGVGAYRYYAFDSGCSCMRYSGGNVAAP
jgi:hypothetical protein